jgi:hypothetical protein
MGPIRLLLIAVATAAWVGTSAWTIAELCTVKPALDTIGRTQQEQEAQTDVVPVVQSEPEINRAASARTSSSPAPGAAGSTSTRSRSQARARWFPQPPFPRCNLSRPPRAQIIARAPG